LIKVDNQSKLSFSASKISKTSKIASKINGPRFGAHRSKLIGSELPREIAAQLLSKLVKSLGEMRKQSLETKREGR
jgi:hypothetical protein